MTARLSLVEELLADQQNLTAVERFSRAHDDRAFAPDARAYCDLIPLEAPRAGEQYAFEVALDKCSGCKACVTACHSLNGLDENETWRDVGLLISPPSKPWKQEPAIQQTITTACHHCIDPACLNGCPVLAYEKDSVTGIVRHLDDQCIGCQYCVLKCPYDVPKYNSRLGIVRKCDMCSSRLAVGEAPACVQACPSEAIRITKVSKSEITIQFREREGTFLAAAPAGDYTLPTTRYINGTTAPRLVAADAVELKPQPAHWPLIVMLILSQASVGVAVITALQRAGTISTFLLSVAFGIAGLGASIFHLGRPMGAWRAFLNLRQSWMSREIVMFGIYMALLTALCAVASGLSGIPGNSISARTLTTVTGLAGILGVFCSAMIYHDTRRPLWHWRRSVLLFFGSAAILGTAATALFQNSDALLAMIAIAVPVKLCIEISTLRHVTDPTLSPLKKTALLITGRFTCVAFARLLCVLLGGVGLPLLLISNALESSLSTTAVMFALLLAGELLERFLFFTTVVAPKMPGGVAS